MFSRNFISSYFIGRLLVSIAVTFCLASSLHTFCVLYNLVALGINISLKTRLLVTIDDLIGLSPTYLPLIVIAFSIAIPVAHFLNGFKSLANRALFPLAGFAAVVTLLLLAYAIMNVTLIAGARGTIGLLLQGLAGCVGGITYAYLLRQRNEHSTE